MYRLRFMRRFMSGRRYLREWWSIRYRWFTVHLMWCLCWFLSSRNNLRGVIHRIWQMTGSVITYTTTIIKKSEHFAPCSFCLLISVLIINIGISLSMTLIHHVGVLFPGYNDLLILHRVIISYILFIVAHYEHISSVIYS